MIFLGGGSMREHISLITSELSLKLMAMDSYRDREGNVQTKFERG